MKYTTLIGSTLGAFCFGIVLCIIHYDYLIIQWPQRISALNHQVETKKTVSLHYWNNHSWHSETQELLWSQDLMQNIQRLLQYWLRLLEDTDVLHKHISVQSVAIAPNQQDLFISFDQNPLVKQWSVMQKWMFIEGLLRTIRLNTQGIQTIFFLLRHQKLSDQHLDFSHPWPLIGYL